MSKIAFCFLIYDRLPFLELWKEFFSQVDENKYNIYVHYKNRPNDLDNELKNLHILDTTIETNWGDISLVVAQNLLLINAMKDPENTNFIFVSNSCIPVKNFYQIKHILGQNSSKSFFTLCPDGQCYPKCDKIVDSIIDINLEDLGVGQHSLPKLNRKDIKKSSQWCILNRKHADILLKSRDYLHWFQNCVGSDELCYITKLHQVKLENEIKTDFRTTLVNWNDEDDTPYTYKDHTQISSEELKNIIISTPHFFMRKFIEGYEFTSEYYDLIRSPSVSGGYSKKKSKKKLKRIKKRNKSF